MTMNMLASAVCCTMGRPQLIEEAIAMFQLQTYQSRELLIVDTVEQMPEAAGDRWRILHISKLIPNWRNGYSMGTLVNAMIRATYGTLTIRWDDDDSYYPWHIEAMVEALQDHQWACPYSCYDAQYGGIQQYRTYRDEFGPKDVAYAGTWGFTREAFEVVGAYREDKFREEEVEFRDRLAKKYGPPGDSTGGKFPMPSYLYGAHHNTVVHYGACTDKQRRDYQTQDWPKWTKITPRWPKSYMLGLPTDRTILPRQFG